MAFSGYAFSSFRGKTCWWGDAVIITAALVIHIFQIDTILIFASLYRATVFVGNTWAATDIFNTVQTVIADLLVIAGGPFFLTFDNFVLCTAI